LEKIFLPAKRGWLGSSRIGGGFYKYKPLEREAVSGAMGKPGVKKIFFCVPLHELYF
jgi:hypothetical protein